MSDLKRWDYERETGMWALDTGEWVLFEDADKRIRDLEQMLATLSAERGCKWNNMDILPTQINSIYPCLLAVQNLFETDKNIVIRMGEYDSYSRTWSWSDGYCRFDDLADDFKLIAWCPLPRYQ